MVVMMIGIVLRRGEGESSVGGSQTRMEEVLEQLEAVARRIPELKEALTLARQEEHGESSMVVSTTTGEPVAGEGGGEEKKEDEEGFFEDQVETKVVRNPKREAAVEELVNATLTRVERDVALLVEVVSARGNHEHALDKAEERAKAIQRDASDLKDWVKEAEAQVEEEDGNGDGDGDGGGGGGGGSQGEGGNREERGGENGEEREGEGGSKKEESKPRKGGEKEGGRKENDGVVGETLTHVKDQVDKLDAEKEDLYKKKKAEEDSELEILVVLEDSDSETRPLGGREGSDSKDKKRKKKERKDKKEGGTGVLSLVDSDNNVYSLTKPRDTSVLFVNRRIVHDVGVTVFVGYIGSGLAESVKLPRMCGLVGVGMILGPSGMDMISNITLVRTLGEVGVLLAVFLLGSSIMKPETRALSLGPATAILGMVLCGLVFVSGVMAHLLERSWFEAALIGVMVSLSAVHLMQSTLLPHERSTPFGEGIEALRIVQEIFTAVVLSVVPYLEAHVFDEGWTLQSAGRGMGYLVGVLLVLVAAEAVTVFVLRRFIPQFSNVAVLSVACAVALGFVYGAEWLHLAPELGAFSGGCVASYMGLGPKEAYAELRSIHRFLVHMFFISIGLSLRAQFFVAEFLLLAVATAFVILCKVVLGSAATALVRAEGTGFALLTGLSIAQISEYSLVLMARARTRNVISKEVHVVVVSVIILSQIIVPLLWNVVGYEWRRRVAAAAHALEDGKLSGV